ncbi:SAM-dependent methyltransferase [Aurantiacibacter gangjinensis]|uniref:Cyclopropane-fatty-acyl-phospholipid synthase n=1 Tax=Aurantiacibacter gangjinensis TaxID=502682 RepID=A0A0G9MPU6_9SPHN|nr:cyclopropane-fatty-acyl-phospholipid synthase family protein [Aurantiacibacter gangjinensis]APE28556.1 Cyclopropane-fatty-acyl-phospholipid synthase, plant type [Aurantiacibacter gangjinensis]KLE32752.1 cyclopropane-fatty-acyl-phospholipid synthase [Aurantiacibacter gangjinensis]
MHGRARAEELLDGGRRFAAKPGLLARLFAPAAQPILDRIHHGLRRGAINGILPDGTPVRLGGHAPGFECVVHLHSYRALARVATGGSIGWYQAWEAGEWSSPDPVPLFALFVENARALGDTARAKGPWRWVARAMHWAKRNTKRQAEKNIHAHYNLGNDFYAAWLDPTMTYSSGYRLEADGALQASQHRKWQRLSDRLGSPETLLEIGCGWGSLAAHFASQGAQATAISLSDEQLDWARAHYPAVDFRKCDYRDMHGQFDAIVSVEMVEALGREYWPDFMDCVARNLEPGGRAAIQYIAMADELFDAYAASADFIQAYVFPGGMLIRASEFRALAEQRGLRWEDQENFGLDYAETLRLWREQFDSAVTEKRLPEGFDKRFIALWRYYLQYCEGGFRGGGITVSQVTLIKGE